jgi:hypothetical protein
MILFLNISDAWLTTGCNTPVRQQKDFVKTINLNVEVSCKDLWSVHDLDLGAADQRPDLIPGGVAGTDAPHHHLSRSGRIIVDATAAVETSVGCIPRQRFDRQLNVPWNSRPLSAPHHLKKLPWREQRADRRVFS